MRRRGFSVFEAVLILGAVGIIMGVLLYPVSSRGTPPSRSGQCQSDLRLIGLGFAQYYQDYDETYPRATTGVGFTGNRSWPAQLMPYIKSPHVFQCPSDALATSSQFVSYGYNSNLGSKQQSVLNSPGWTIVNYEVTGSPLARSGQSLLAVTAPRRHLGGSNFLFADGHTKWLKPSSVSAVPSNILPSFGFPSEHSSSQKVY